LKNLDNLRQPDRVSAWLVTTARRECWERRRGVDFKRTFSAESDQLLIDKSSDVPSPEEEVAAFESHENLRSAMDELDARCQKLLYHLYYDSDQPSYADVAQILDIPIGSIGPLRVRCLKKLRKIYDNSS
jgi:RNA polymerase sigma factor (sigma-70 family)